MKYILRYEIKSKYIGYSKVHYKEFNTIEQLLLFTLDKAITKYEIYKKEGKK